MWNTEGSERSHERALLPDEGSRQIGAEITEGKRSGNQRETEVKMRGLILDIMEFAESLSRQKKKEMSIEGKKTKDWAGEPHSGAREGVSREQQQVPNTECGGCPPAKRS